MRKTKIVCTIGPACDDQKKIEALIKSGMDVARLNLSHNTHQYHQKTIKKIRVVAKKLNKLIPIIIDIQGPKIRIGQLTNKTTLIPNSFVWLGDSSFQISKKKNQIDSIPLTYPNLYKYLKPGDKIFIGDSQMELEVNEIINQQIKCLVVQGGTLFSKMGINIPNISLKIDVISQKDIEDIKFGVKNNVDFIALSFVTAGKDLENLRKIIKKYQEQQKNDIQNTTIKIIAKIERLIAVEKIDEIIQVADAIMIARGDLGIEISVEKVPLVQKMIIKKCLFQAKPVIVATQMLSSMQSCPSPTRAEASDVANAVIDQADALMLSEETSIGQYPIQSIKAMTKIILQAEQFEDKQFNPLKAYLSECEDMNIDDTLLLSLNLIAQKIKAKLIFVVSLTGYTGRIVSRFRPKIPLFVFTCNQKISRQLSLNWGLFPFTLASNKQLCQPLNKNKDQAIDYFIKNSILKKGDVILIVGRKEREYLNSIDWIEIKHIGPTA